LSHDRWRPREEQQVVTLAAPIPDQPLPGNLPRASPFRWLRRDPVLLSAFVIVGLLIGYQLVVTLLQPPWIGPATDWLRAVLAWPELAVVVGVALWLTRTHQPDASSAWMLSLALLSYTVARTLWTVSDQLIFHQGVPFPTYPDLFFVLQYPFFFLFLALLLLPSLPPGGPRAKLILDSLLWTGAAAALTWYFILAPEYQASWMSPPAKLVSLFYPVGDLLILFVLVRTMLRPPPSRAMQPARYILGLAFVCLITADAWVALLILLNLHHVYLTGHAPDEFWLAFYLLVPLAALVRWRLALHEPLAPQPPPVSARTPQQLHRQDLLASLRFLAPLVAALLAGGVILIHATHTALTSPAAQRVSLVAPFAVTGGLLLLALVRQEVTFLENAQLQREREATRLEMLVLREANRRMDEFLSIVSHELKTPLTSLMGNLQLLMRRLRKARLDHDEVEGRPDDRAALVAMVRAMAARLEVGLERLGRLVDDLLDESRIQSGRLELHRAPTDLAAVVQAAVEEQRLLVGSRPIHLTLPADTQPMLVSADAGRIEQVVSNYLTNALKYSAEDRPVEVELQVDGKSARVWVRDQGVGVPLADQPYIWERFHRAAGVTIQSGSGVGIGLGLHISKSIVEQHGGHVGVESTPGQGSTFWFTLPLAAAVGGDASIAAPSS
jgi:signal transduction histidine kinase